MSKRLIWVLPLFIAACSSPDGGGTASAVTESASVSAPVSSASAAPAAGVPMGSFSCGALQCESFDSPNAAFERLLSMEQPLVLALGESHAQKGDPPVKSTTARFTEDLLPKLSGRATSLVLELWVADGSCGKKKEAAVAQQQREVVKNQADTNQNEFVTLGQKSKDLGIIPFILRPSCEEYDHVQKAGKDGFMEMLTVITHHMNDKATKLFKETQTKSKGKMVVTYGGGMHNDRAPNPGAEDWSFAADLDKVSGGRYVELDLIVPEFIKDDSPTWKKLPWYPSYDRERFGKSTVLIKMGERSYALLFPRT